MSATYCRDKRPRPIGIEEYGIHRRARHMVSETQRLSQASFQKLKVSTASTTLKASESEAANSASQKRERGAHEHHVTHHEHAERDQTGGDETAQLRGPPHPADKAIHGARAGKNTGGRLEPPAEEPASGYLTLSAASMSCLPSGTSFENSAYELSRATFSH